MTPRLTALAIEVATDAGMVIPGTICYLVSPSVTSGFLFAITNNDGYAVWNNVPLPFTGKLQLAAAVMPYGPGGNGVDITLPDGQNLTLRVGHKNFEPQDLQLPGAVPFV